MRITMLGALMLLVLVAFVPASAEEPAETLDLAAVAAAPAATPAVAEPQPSACGWPDLAQALAGDPQPNVAGTCTATCWDGSSRTCEGSSCSAVDSNCPNQIGYCWSDLEGTKYCPACPPCHTVDCGCENQPCVKNSQCGTCFGYQCICAGPVGNKRCICP